MDYALECNPMTPLYFSIILKKVKQVFYPQMYLKINVISEIIKVYTLQIGFIVLLLLK